MKAHNLEIETLRGLACLLLVVHHSIGGFYNAGYLDESSFLIKVSVALKFLRMPLFTFISGYVFALYPVTAPGLKQFFTGKIRRLCIPLIIIGVPLAILQSVFGVNEKFVIWDAILSPIFPKTLFWYLNALLVIFSIVAILEVMGLLKSFSSAVLLLGFSIIIFVSPLRNIEFFAIGRAFYLLPHFLLGIIMCRFVSVWDKDISKPVILISFIVACCTLFLTIKGIVVSGDVMTPGFYPVLISIMLCSGVYSLKLKSLFLAKIGLFSYSIFLYHSLAAPTLRAFLVKIFGRDFFHQSINIYVFIVVGAIFGIIVPILIHKLFIRNKLTSLLFLGIKKKVATV